MQERQLLGQETQMAPLGKYLGSQLEQLKAVQEIQLALQLTQTLFPSLVLDGHAHLFNVELN